MIKFRHKAKNLEVYNKNKFINFLASGKKLIDYCNEGDLDNFKKIFVNADDKELMYWHLTKCFKAALKQKNLKMIEFMIEDLDMPLNHEAFDGLLHIFVFSCQEAEMEKDELQQELNRLILKYLVKGVGKQSIDPIDKANGSTPLIMACEYLNDLSIVETLVDGGADVNAVNCDNGMPLNLIKARLKKDPENYDLQDIYDYLKRKGAVRDWRKLTKKIDY